MTDDDCIEFLQTVLPRLGLHWPGYRKVRGLVRKRLGRRLRGLRISDLRAYVRYLENHREEWDMLDELCHIPISRFFRDRGVFEHLEHEVLPALAEAAAAQGRNELACWSACCASGEEAYTLALLWRLRVKRRFPQPQLRIVATDIDAHLLERARSGCYRSSSLKALPEDLLAAGFIRRETQFCVRNEFRAIEFLQQDIRKVVPDAEFDLVLCRNAVLTYMAPPLRRQVVQRVISRVRPGGALVIGIHESLPDGLSEITAWPGARAIYRKLECGANPAARCPRSLLPCSQDPGGSAAN